MSAQFPTVRAQRGAAEHDAAGSSCASPTSPYGADRPAAGGGRRRPAQRRQVDAGQPHHRPPAGGRRGRPRGDPGPGALRRAVERPARSPWWTPAAGSPTPRTGPRPSPPRPRSPWPTADVVLFVVDATVGADRRGRGRGEDAAAQRQAGDPGRQQGRQRRASRSRRPRCGRSASASRTRSPRCTAAAPATCSTPSWPRCPTPPPIVENRPARPAPGGAGRPAQRRQVQPAQPVLRRGAGGRRLGRRHHRRPGGQPGRDRRRDLAARRHRRSAQAGRHRPAAPSTTPACAPPAPSRRPRWPWCCSTPASRSASRTSGS